MDFVAIDFETANPKRVSACALGVVKVSNKKIVEKVSFLIKPVGGHAELQTKIHGIGDEHTRDMPDFRAVYDDVKDIFEYQLVGHSLFDKQVLKALSEHFNLNLNPNYVDSSALAKEKLPTLKNHKLKTLANHFGLPAFKHHDAGEDANACATIFLKIQELGTLKECSEPSDDLSELIGIAKGILADDEVNYKEVCSLLYWLEDHADFLERYEELYIASKNALEDDHLDSFEATSIKNHLKQLSEFSRM